jgi:hypothetical protein
LLRLEEQFVGNSKTHVLILDVEFHNFVQGDLSIFDYRRRLKGMADTLGDLEEVIQDRSLVLTMLRGLNDCFFHMAAFLKRQRPFLTFAQVRNDLHLEEIELLSKPGGPSTALVATTLGAHPLSPAAPVGAPPPTVNMSAPALKKLNIKNKNKGNNHGMPSLPTPTHPWNDTLQLWAGAAAACPGGPSLLDTRPGLPQPHPA